MYGSTVMWLDFFAEMAQNGVDGGGGEGVPGLIAGGGPVLPGAGWLS